jgi:hypothetical protein
LPSGICFSQFLTFSYFLSRVEGRALLLIQIEGRTILCRDRNGQMLKASERVQIYPLIDHYVKIQVKVIADYAENTLSAAVIAHLHPASADFFERNGMLRGGYRGLPL